MSQPVAHTRFPLRRGPVTRASTWWGKAWVRALEELAIDETDLKRARKLSRSGRLGAISVGPGTAVVTVEDPSGDAFTARVDLETLDGPAWSVFLDELAGRSGHAAALLAGELPHALMEDAESAGVELLPYGSELEASCDCDAWAQPCVHTLALTYQLGWLIDDDPFLLFLLRGRSRAELLAGLSARFDAQAGPAGSEPPPGPDPGVDGAVAEAAARARMVLGLAAQAPLGDGLADPAVAAYDGAVQSLLTPSG